MLIHLLPFLVLVPMLGFVGCLLAPRTWERTIFSTAISALALEFALLACLVYRWIGQDFSPIFRGAHPLYAGHHYVLSLDLYFDGLAAVFLGMTTVMTALVFVFSKYYMHRDQGFKRFYATVFLFFIGLSLAILAGNFEVLFVGWELIGISSVLLIAFYRDRFLPARNAQKVFSLYRIADACLLAALWYAHYFFGKNVTFADFSGLIMQHGNRIVLLGGLLFGAALIKSAQFPFSYWLPRAMEGPTTSSAIFYGALSVHMGLYLLLRTYPLWDGSGWLRMTIAISGLVTAIIASTIARVQSSIKTQIAYASITQIGIMFIELAAGLKWLVLLHFISNAALRTYQLLISPSVVSYLVHDQFFYFVPPALRIKHTFFGKLRATFFTLGIKEWNMNTAVSHYLWRPLKSLGRACAFLDKLGIQAIALGLFVLAMKVVKARHPSGSLLIVSTGAAVLSFIFYVRAYTTKGAAKTCWNLIMLGHLFGALFLMAAYGWDGKLLGMYGTGIVAAFVVGHSCLWYLRAKGEPDALDDYRGSIFTFAKLGQLFFIVSLLFMAFPISSSFLAQDILLSSVPGNHAFLVVLFCLSYVISGVSIMRLYTKLFFGPHKASYHERAFRSS